MGLFQTLQSTEPFTSSELEATDRRDKRWFGMVETAKNEIQQPSSSDTLRNYVNGGIQNNSDLVNIQGAEVTPTL